MEGGRAESIRWMLAAYGIEFEENFIEEKEQYDQMVKNGDLMFQQLPMVEMDGMKLVSSRAILNYIAGKCNIYGKDLKEKAFIDMYVDGNSDLMALLLAMPFLKEDEKEAKRSY
ncbi:unnamed protein product [Staurois parvus]|uniref:glutathione transferase n=1 Tax=Staurois parvus TaxID=386267 RepID=A0ABN9H803_9NEOB|nr:unnamed protein product [Staurois parvus]